MIRHQSAMIVSIYIEIGASFLLWKSESKIKSFVPSCVLTVYVDVTSDFVYRKKRKEFTK